MEVADTKRIRPPNSVVLVMDARGVVPQRMSGALATTSSAIALGTRATADGDTQVSVCDSRPPAGDLQPVFDGNLETPSGHLLVQSVEGDRYFDVPVARDPVHLMVLTNDPAEPDVIVVVLAE